MTQIPMLVPPPDNWQDFENLTFSLCKAIWPHGDFNRHGRHGQAQQGVDIYGVVNGSKFDEKEWLGIQCKRRNNADALAEQKASGQLSLQAINDEVKKAEEFTPALNKYIIATTVSRDALIQSKIRAMSDARLSKSQFSINVWFWEDIQADLNQHLHVMYRYYSDILKLHSLYNADNHILSLLYLAFSRPAFNTYLHMENNSDDFLQAIKDTQSAIKIGVLKDRESGDIVRSAPTGVNGLSNEKWKLSLEAVYQNLAQMRDIYTDATRAGVIVQQRNFTLIHDHTLSEHLNRMRANAIADLNVILSEAGLDTVKSNLLQFRGW